MARQWLNVFIDQGGNAPPSQWVTRSDVVQLNAKAIRIIESDRSGSVTMTHSELSSYGDSEVYLKINFQDGTFRYLSAPLHTDVEVPNVASLELTILLLVGPTGTPYRALVNAHCVYEVL
ncbi:hypothetical protein W02_40760 [Nitrospira sp. KM1]|uniref:hypothetical protein n=1 Tax=Nitrospira sp. KM1 TaxID=1936990 RepID=UPI0013A73CE3|nr:hypothetical protein [Nitrospira sp. KM1]BCA56936.1 hypothetical protein W02_40760 [Nitrospira sp. KM1]